MLNSSVKARWLLFVFGVAAIVNIVANLMVIPALVVLSKPLLMTSLAGFFWRNRSGYAYEKWLLIGLLFAFLGDSFLLGTSPLFFLLGLGSFLLTQLFYTVSFQIQTQKANQLSTSTLLVAIVPFLTYSIGLLLLLWKDLPSNFKIPIVLYSSVITVMAMAGTYLALQTKNVLLAVGVILFVVSDSCIAIDKFTEIELPVVRLLIMGTYIGAQLAIVWSQLQLSSKIYGDAHGHLNHL
jgi:uncharacterized membrane protein YhhN